MNRTNLFESGQRCNCQRCGALVKVDPLDGSKAKMLKRSKDVKGLCINCAVHDWLRNTYPLNLLLAKAGPRGLALTHIQEEFAGIMKLQISDAVPDEIGWQAIIDNWELPFPTKLKRTAINPVDQAELDRYPEEERKRSKLRDERLNDPRSDEEIFEAKQKEAGKLLINIMREVHAKNDENSQENHSDRQ